MFCVSKVSTGNITVQWSVDVGDLASSVSMGCVGNDINIICPTAKNMSG